MSWDTICQYLVENLVPHIEPDRLQQILGKLTAEKHGKRLSVCLALDLKHEAIGAEQLAALLNTIDATEDICPQFHAKSPPFRRCARQIKPLDSSDRYVRVISLWSAHTYYISPSMPCLTMDAADLKEARQQLYRWQKGGVPVVNRTYSGYRDLVWVTRWTEVDQFLRAEDAATRLNDSLGLGLRGKPEMRDLWAFCYQPQFIMVCRRPSTYDASWQSDAPFLASATPEDDWGETHPCKRGSKGLPERVHAGFDGYMNLFSVHNVGLADPLEVDWDAVLESGFMRFSD